MQILTPRRALFLAVSSAMVLASTPSFGLTINITGATCTPTVDTAGNITIACAGGGGQNPVCVVSPASQTKDAAGGAIAQLTASNCGAGSWTSTRAGWNASASCGTGATCSDSLPANTATTSRSITYTFTGANGSASGTVVQSGASNEPNPGPISCSNIPGVTNTRVVSVPWEVASWRGVTTATKGGFRAGEAVVFTFTVPTGISYPGSIGRFVTSPTDAKAYNLRTVAMSDKPCDFSGTLGINSVTYGLEGSTYFTVDSPNRDRYGRTTMPNLQAGRTYYVTVLASEMVGSANTCLHDQCNVDYALFPPK